MIRIAAALISGLVIGAGLTVSHMINPRKILDFLDLAAIPAGGWDPSLALVMAGAVVTTALGYAMSFRRTRPWFADKFAVPTRRDIDIRLVGGAILFGLGWGLVGFCPGPALAALSIGGLDVAIFVAAMAAGMALYHLLFERTPPTGATTAPDHRARSN